MDKIVIGDVGLPVALVVWRASANMGRPRGIEVLPRLVEQLGAIKLRFKEACHEQRA